MQLYLANDTSIDLQHIDISTLNVIQTAIEKNQVLFDQNDFIVENKVTNHYMVSANRFQIEELVSNLFSNAIKYTPQNKKGLIQVTAQLENDRVKVSITDNGKGLNEDEITHVFDKYYKGKTDRK